MHNCANKSGLWYKSKSQALENKYSQLFFEENLFEIMPTDFDLFLSASKTGAESGLKLVDAIHFQSAIQSQFKAFITNDALFYSTETMIKSCLNSYKQLRLLEHFVAGTTARTAATLVGVNKSTSAFYFHRLRELIYLQCEESILEQFACEIEVDES